MRVALIAVLLAGCAEYRWVKLGATEQDFARDRYECNVDAQRFEPGARLQMWQECLRVRGWTAQQVER